MDRYESRLKIVKKVVVQKRAKFNQIKDDLIKEWETNTGKEWTRYKEDLYIELKDGTKKLIRKAGDLFDAHHIKPSSWGG